MTFRATSLLCASLLTLAACDIAQEPTGPRQAGDGGELTISAPPRGGVVQHISVQPKRPAPGDTVSIRSVLRGASANPVRVSARICGAELEGTLELSPVGAVCGGYSVTRPLAGNDSLVTSESRRVESRPGSYEVRIRHALDPEIWVTIPIEVRPR